jgi:hypothetical protein
MNLLNVTMTKCDIRPAESRKGVRNRTTSLVYIWQDNNPNEKPLKDIFSGFRWNKPHGFYKQVVMPSVLKRMGLPDTTEVKWSQSAGCSCGCSPAFVVYSKCPPKEVFVHVTITPQQAELALA